jgi:hypothetical protein
MRIATLALCIAIGGCAAETRPGNTCISEGMFEGDRIRHLETGKIGTVLKRHGASPRCSQASHPIWADVQY